MNKVEQQREIAIFCGYRAIHVTEAAGGVPVLMGSIPPLRMVYPIPDFLNDLNAMRGAELQMGRGQWHPYLCALEKILGFHIGPGGWDMDQESLFAFTTATAAQRAEALLRSIDKWEDDE